MPLRTKAAKPAKTHPKSDRYELPVLKDRKGDLRQRWYIEYRAWDAVAKKKVRQVKYCPIAHKTELERRRWARPIIIEISQLMNDGYYQLIQSTPQPSAVSAAVVPEPPATLMQAIEQMVDLKASTHRPRTATTYRNVQYRLKEYLAHRGQLLMPLADITPKHIVGLLDYYSTARKLSNTYRNDLVEGLSALFNMLIERELLTVNPCQKVRALPERPTRTNIAYTNDQQAVFEEYLLTTNVPLYRLTRFIYQAFIRPLELCQLQVRDIELDNNRIALHGSITKTVHQGSKDEYVQITPPLREVITDMKLYLYQPTDYVFSLGLKPGSRQIHRNGMTDRHNKALKAAGLYNGELTQYSWKHTGVVNAHRAGNHIEWLQRQLRHTTLEQTCVYLKSLGLMLHERADIAPW